VLLIEDDPYTRTLPASIVNTHEQLNITAAVGTLQEGKYELEKSQPDVLPVDLGLPDGDGTELTHKLYHLNDSTDAICHYCLWR